jgi:hypothetical protein
MYEVLKLIGKNKHRLTKQQYKTLRGQCLAGDAVGALKGLNKILRKFNSKTERG